MSKLVRRTELIDGSCKEEIIVWEKLIFESNQDNTPNVSLWYRRDYNENNFGSVNICTLVLRHNEKHFLQSSFVFKSEDHLKELMKDACANIIKTAIGKLNSTLKQYEDVKYFISNEGVNIV